MILIADHDAMQRNFARTVFEAAGLSARDVEDGFLVSNALATETFALVLLDICLPGRDGFATARAIRAAENGGVAVPIFAFTSLSCADLDREAYRAGMDGVVRKPCSPDALLAAVEPWLVAGRAIDRLASVFGADRIDTLLVGFRAQLSDAVARIEETGGGTRAHRLAGLAGTLGFAEVSATWFELSEGKDSALPKARLSAERALRQIHIRLTKRGDC